MTYANSLSRPAARPFHLGGDGGRGSPRPPALPCLHPAGGQQETVPGTGGHHRDLNALEDLPRRW
jgi:hypothetical protein